MLLPQQSTFPCRKHLCPRQWLRIAAPRKLELIRMIRRVHFEDKIQLRFRMPQHVLIKRRFMQDLAAPPQLARQRQPRW